MRRREEAEAEVVLNRVQGVPLHLQLERQLEYMICTGAFREGQLLPSIRTLAHSLRMSAGTVRRAFGQLAERGLVESHQGRGVAVTRRDPGGSRFALNIELRVLLESSLHRARTLGFSNEQIVRSALEILRALEGRIEVAFVAFNEYVARRYAKLVEDEFVDYDLKVLPVTLAALRAEESVRRRAFGTRFVITQLYHFAEVQRLLAGLETTVVPIRVLLSRASHEQLAALPKVGRIGVVCDETLSAASFAALSIYRTDKRNWVYASPADERRLHKLRQVCASVLLNGIDEATARHLLGERATLVHLTYVPSEESMTRLHIEISRALIPAKMPAALLPTAVEGRG